MATTIADLEAKLRLDLGVDQSAMNRVNELKNTLSSIENAKGLSGTQSGAVQSALGAVNALKSQSAAQQSATLSTIAYASQQAASATVAQRMRDTILAQGVAVRNLGSTMASVAATAGTGFMTMLSGIGNQFSVLALAAGGFGSKILAGLTLAFSTSGGLAPVKRAFESVGKTVGEAGVRGFAEVMDLSAKYGVSLEQLGQNFAKLKAATTGTELSGGFKQFLDNVLGTATQLGMSTEKIAGFSRVLEGMVSRGKVTFDDFKQGLGELVPNNSLVALRAYLDLVGKTKDDINGLAQAKIVAARSAGAEMSREEAILRVYSEEALKFKAALKSGSIDGAQFAQAYANNANMLFGGGTAQAKLGGGLDMIIGQLAANWGKLVDQLQTTFGASNIAVKALNKLSEAVTYITEQIEELGPVAALAFGVASVVAINKATGAIGALVGKVGLLNTGLLALAGVGIFMAMGTEADEASKRVDALEKKTKDLRAEFAEKGLDAELQGKVAAGATAAEASIKALEGELARLERQADLVGKKLVDKFFDRSGSPGLEDSWVAKLFRDMTNTQLSGEITKELERVRSEITRLKAAQEELKPVQDAFAAAASGAAEGLKEEESAVDALASRIEVLDKRAQSATDKLNILRSSGLQALKDADSADAIRKSAGLGPGEGESSVRKVIAAERELATARKEAERIESGRAEKDANHYKAIIERANAVMDGQGLKDADALKKAVEAQYAYQDALVKTGTSYADAIVKAEEYRRALDMAREGLNLNTLQFKPFSAMQKSMESFTDSIADLVSKGKLNMQSFSEAARNMATSFIKDIIAMALKAAIVKPLLTSVFGATTGGGGGDMGLGSWATSIVPNAKGGVFDQPTYFSGNGSMNVMGEAGPEAVVPLRRGPNGALGISAYGGGDGGGGGAVVNVAVNVTAPAGTTARETGRRSSGGGSGMEIDVLIEQFDSAMAGRIAEGRSPTGQAIKSTFGLSSVSGAR